MAHIMPFTTLTPILDGNNDFSIDLYKVLSEGAGNVFFSPLSIQITLALVFLGAKGDTAKEIARGLHLPDDKKAVENRIAAISNQLDESNEVMLDIANKIYLQRGYKIKENFNQSVVRFKAGAEALNFAASEESRAIINNWVEKKTHEKIKDLIHTGVLSSDTRMVLVNAIYFKGDWLKKFDKESTVVAPFHSVASKDVSMMHLKDSFKYTEVHELNSQILLLPYKGNKLSMMLVLPREENGISSLEKKLTGVNIFEIVEKMTRSDVLVYLPKFKLEYEKELQQALQTLGMAAMFDSRKADFTGISDESLEVSNVVHKAFVEVNEEGTEAASATGAVVAAYAAIPDKVQPIIFRANHPFIFFVISHQTRYVLFAGRVCSPAG